MLTHVPPLHPACQPCSHKGLRLVKGACVGAHRPHKPARTCKHADRNCAACRKRRPLQCASCKRGYRLDKRGRCVRLRHSHKRHGHHY